MAAADSVSCILATGLTGEANTACFSQLSITAHQILPYMPFVVQSMHTRQDTVVLADYIFLVVRARPPKPRTRAGPVHDRGWFDLSTSLRKYGRRLLLSQHTFLPYAQLPHQRLLINWKFTSATASNVLIQRGVRLREELYYSTLTYSYLMTSGSICFRFPN